MGRRLLFFCLAFLGATQIFSDITTTHGSIKLVHAKATTTRSPASIKITDPSPDGLVPGPDVTIRFTLKNWKVGKNSEHLHFLLDNGAFEEHSSSEPFVFRNVKPGAHTIRVFPVHAWHESVKQQSAMAFVQFYVGRRSGEFPFDFAKPMMIYNTPLGSHSASEQPGGQPYPGILVDWFLHNISMGSKAGYFVRLSVDGETLMSMKEWRPHYLQGLRTGEHKIKLELVRNETPVGSNVTERIIQVQ